MEYVEAYARIHDKPELSAHQAGLEIAQELLARDIKTNPRSAGGYIWAKRHGFSSLQEYEQYRVNKNKQECREEPVEETTKIHPIDGSELREILENLVNGLDVKERIAIEGYFMESLNQEDIRKMMGVTRARVGQLIETALEKMHKRALKTEMVGYLAERGSRGYVRSISLKDACFRKHPLTEWRNGTPYLSI